MLLDRHHGLTLKVPDGRGNLVAGCTYSNFEKRHAWREQFESMRCFTSPRRALKTV